MAPAAEDDPLQALHDRVRATQDAVDRLAEEARRAREEAAGGGVPAAGADATDELRALVGLFDMLRGLLPADLQAQIAELVRQFLLLVRAILDWWIERMEVPPPAPAADAQDIEVR